MFRLTGAYQVYCNYLKKLELKRMLQFVILLTEQLDIPLNKSAATDKVTIPALLSIQTINSFDYLNFTYNCLH